MITGSFDVNVNISKGILDGVNIFVVKYNLGDMINECKAVNSNSFTFDVTDDAKIRMFVWKSYAGNEPLTDVYTLSR